MFSSTKLRRYALLGLIFSVCFSGLVLFSDKSTAIKSMNSVALSTQAASKPSLTTGVRKTVLDNGLTVLTKEIHTAPVVSVQVWYRVGSRNEAPGLNGISHQLEHLLFKGTSDRPIQFGRLFSALGSASNAFTGYDQTAYFGTVSRDKLNALLVLEADRMANALINAEQLASEKRVVISELQGYENSPDYRLGRAVQRAAFPERPYGLPVGGTKADVQRFTVQEVQNYYRTYYSPDNAVLVVTGDFNTQQVLDNIKQNFAKIPNAPKTSPSPKSVSSKPVTVAPKAPIILREPGSAALIEAVYPLPDVNHPDVPAIDVMDAILTAGRSSRLYQALVETGLASSAEAYAAELIDPGWYNISVTAVPGQNLQKVDQVLQQAISNLRQRQVTPEELNRAKTQVKADFILSNRDIDNQASQLAYSQIVAGDYQYSDRYLAGIERVTTADVQRVAQTYLDPAKRIVGFFQPTQVEGQSPAGNPPPTQTAENFSPGQPVDPAEVAKYLPVTPPETTSASQALPEKLTLANGLRVLLLPDASTPTVTLSGHIQAGSSFDIAAKAGVASLTAENLMNGTKTKDALALAKALEERGANLDFSAFREGVDVQGYALREDLPTLLNTLADVVQHATFPEDELELSRQRALTSLQEELDDPNRLGRRVFQQTVYPQDHPFHVFATPISLKKITRNDIASFYQKHYLPETTILTLVGDFDSAEVRSLLNQTFGKWTSAATPPEPLFPKVPLPKAIEYLNPALPGKTQAITYLGYQGIDRKDPRYYAALVLNQVLGGDTLSSRLGTEIRDRQGLTYGIYSYFAAGQQAGPFLIQMQTAPEDTQQAIASTLALLEQFRKQGVTEAEFSAAKRSLLNSYPVELASLDTLANTILNNEVFGLGTEEIRQFPRQIEAVTLAQVEQAIQTLIHPNNLVVVTAGPKVSSFLQGNQP